VQLVRDILPPQSVLFKALASLHAHGRMKTIDEIFYLRAAFFRNPYELDPHAGAQHDVAHYSYSAHLIAAYEREFQLYFAARGHNGAFYVRPANAQI
jgi:hypothetical protein